MPQAQFFINIACHLRDAWLKTDKDTQQNQDDLTGLGNAINEANEFLYYIQDLYEVLTYEPY